MCTGMEPGLLAAAAGTAAPAATAAATALPVIAPTVAEAGIGSMLAAAPEIAAPIAADAASATLAAADSAVLPALSSIGPAQGSVLANGLQASGAQALAAPAAEVAVPGSTFLGMSPAQWGQQLVTQGGAAALQTLGNMQAQDATNDTLDSYNQGISDWEKEQLAAVDEGLKGFSAEQIAANRKKYSDEMMATFDANAPKRDSFGTLLLSSTPDEVKADYAAKQQASTDYARSQFAKSTDLTSLGRAMTSGAQGMQDALSRANMNKYSLNSYMAGLSPSLQAAGSSGALSSGLGNLTSSLGNMLLASQTASGSKPASVTDIR